MRYDSPLQEARLLQRYQRFLADVVLPDGSELTLHCPNTGSMRGCMPEAGRVWYSKSDKPGRKYPHTWEQVETPEGHRVGIHTGRANVLVAEALREGWIPEFRGYDRVVPEVQVGRSRVDFVLEGEGESCHLEVKSVTLAVEGGLGLFPDAVSQRARRHLEDLTERARAGLPAALCYCVQHTGIERVAPADDVDPAYGDAFRMAIDAGVMVMAWQAELNACEAKLLRPLPVLRQWPHDLAD